MEPWYKRAWQWIVKHWKLIAAAAATIAAVLVVSSIARAIMRKVNEKRNFAKVPGDPTSLLIQDGEEWTKVKLPKGVRSDRVSAAGISDGEWAVEVKHEATDRHGDPGLDDGGSLGISG